ncbi:MAG: type II toxin-antitoxin system RelE/ParE family toxin [Rhizobiaceae bacterium]
MKKYQTSARADADIKEVYKYSARQFGYTQANDYLARLYDQFSKLAVTPDIGKRLKFGSKIYQQQQYESHLIFYRKRRNEILIVRVLHKSMDIKQHL